MISKKAIFTFLLTISIQMLFAQKPSFKELPSLPDKEGFAGMFAGVINDKIICMGGANFPGKKPWEKGTKIWYDDIFVFDGNKWNKRSEKLPLPLGYGVSASWKNRLIIAGGNNADGFYNKVYQLEIVRNKIVISPIHALPIPIAFATGARLDNLFIIAGGDSSSTGKPLKKCFVMDLDDTKKGWVELDTWPGPARHFPVCGVKDNIFYLFSGETVRKDKQGNNQRQILNDVYALSISKKNETYTADWKKLNYMPKGISAAPFPAPYLPEKGFVFWGGVDEVTALYTDAATHMGINNYIINYSIEKDSWSTMTKQDIYPARVGAPVVFYKGEWVYISGEVKPGIRTNKIISIK
jgi:N-acetylneuraminate epimerase